MATYTFTAHDVTINGGNINVVGSSTFTIVLTDDDSTIGDPGDTGEMISIDGGAPQPYTFSGIGVTDVGENMAVIDVGGTLYAFNTDGGQLDNGNTKVQLSDLISDPIVPCFTPGTSILTPLGNVLIEDLQDGDLVVTNDAGLQPIAKIIRRRVSLVELKSCPNLRPIRIGQGALGDDRPTRAMVVSPQHRFLFSDWRALLLFGEASVLATARSLVNDTTVRVADLTNGIDYIHLVLREHHIICANGAWTESVLLSQDFLDTLSRPMAVELTTLFPKLVQKSDSEAMPAAAPILRHYEGNLLTDPDLS